MLLYALAVKVNWLKDHDSMMKTIFSRGMSIDIYLWYVIVAIFSASRLSNCFTLLSKTSDLHYHFALYIVFIDLHWPEHDVDY